MDIYEHINELYDRKREIELGAAKLALISNTKKGN